MAELKLSTAEAESAAGIQKAIDSLGDGGGSVVLPQGELDLDRGLELRAGVELVGQGRGTVLRKAPGRVYPLAGYHNYGMHDVPLQYTEGLEPGMTVAVRDSTHGGFFETFARITWVEGTWVGIDRGLDSDYYADKEPVLVTSFPLVFGLGVGRVALKNIMLDGNRARQPEGIGACRGAAVYFYQCSDFEVSGVEEHGFAGEGLGFQMCRRGRIAECRFADNTGNGYHPGAGSTGACFEDCVSEGNGAAGFYFCVRANHVTVRDCTFEGNQVCGLSIGTRDCYNLVEKCRFVKNGGPGVLVRPTARPVEVHSCRIAGCTAAGNARKTGRGQIDILGDAHDLVLTENVIVGAPGGETAGLYVAPSAERIWAQDNDIKNCFPEVVGDASCFADREPSFDCGSEDARNSHFRHLP